MKSDCIAARTFRSGADEPRTDGGGGVSPIMRPSIICVKIVSGRTPYTLTVFWYTSQA